MSGIHHIALRVTNCETSARFYERAFGLREWRRFGEKDEARAIWLRGEGMVLMLERSLRGTGVAQGSGHVLVFATPDLGAADRRLQDFGIQISDRTEQTLYVEDPDGHRCGLSAYRFDETPS